MRQRRAQSAGPSRCRVAAVKAAGKSCTFLAAPARLGPPLAEKMCMACACRRDVWCLACVYVCMRQFMGVQYVGVYMALLGFELNARVIHRIHTRFTCATQPHRRQDRNAGECLCTASVRVSRAAERIQAIQRSTRYQRNMQRSARPHHVLCSIGFACWRGAW